MAQAEQPERLRPQYKVSVDDVRQLMGASTPHFALQLRNRIRTLIAGLFLAGNVLIYLPAALYSGSLFMRALFGEGVPLLAFATILAVISAAYAIFGGLRAVAVM